MIQQALALLAEGKDIPRDVATASLDTIMDGEATPAQIGAFLMGLRVKGETADEITGLAKSMRAHATKIHTSRTPLVDTCGTGGSGTGKFNVSTTSAIVVAASGVAVAKHGNRSASSKCGSADVLEALGVNIDASPEVVGRCIDEVGVGFLFARSLHSAMKHVAGPRMELKVRTVFNLLGPLTNPAGACGQVMGVPDAALVEKLAGVLQQLGTRRAFVVTGEGGLDELSLSGPSQVAEADANGVKTYTLLPEDLDLTPAPLDTIIGGEPEQNAELLSDVLDGKLGPHRDIVILNAAAGILAGGSEADWRQAADCAAAAIDSGAAKETLAKLIETSQATEPMT